jgi:hypothetical protein
MLEAVLIFSVVVSQNSSLHWQGLEKRSKHVQLIFTSKRYWIKFKISIFWETYIEKHFNVIFEYSQIATWHLIFDHKSKLYCTFWITKLSKFSILYLRQELFRAWCELTKSVFLHIEPWLHSTFSFPNLYWALQENTNVKKIKRKKWDKDLE